MFSLHLNFLKLLWVRETQDLAMGLHITSVWSWILTSLLYRTCVTTACTDPHFESELAGIPPHHPGDNVALTFGLSTFECWMGTEDDGDSWTFCLSEGRGFYPRLRDPAHPILLWADFTGPLPGDSGGTSPRGSCVRREGGAFCWEISVCPAIDNFLISQES